MYIGATPKVRHNSSGSHEKVGNDHKRSRRQLGSIIPREAKVPEPSVCHPSQTVRWLGPSETNQIETLADGEDL